MKCTFKMIGSYLSCTSRSVFIDSLVSRLINLKSQRSKEISLFHVNLIYHLLVLRKNVFSRVAIRKITCFGYSQTSKQRSLAERERGTLARSRVICSSRNIREINMPHCKGFAHNCTKMSTYIKKNCNYTGFTCQEGVTIN